MDKDDHWFTECAQVTTCIACRPSFGFTLVLDELNHRPHLGWKTLHCSIFDQFGQRLQKQFSSARKLQSIDMSYT